jgi:hypothetical protein
MNFAGFRELAPSLAATLARHRVSRRTPLSTPPSVG